MFLWPDQRGMKWPISAWQLGRNSKWKTMGRNTDRLNRKVLCHYLEATVEVVHGKRVGEVRRKLDARKRSINTFISVWYTHTPAYALFLHKCLRNGSSKPHRAITFWDFQHLGFCSTESLQPLLHIDINLTARRQNTPFHWFHQRWYNTNCHTPFTSAP